MVSIPSLRTSRRVSTDIRAARTTPATGEQTHNALARLGGVAANIANTLVQKRAIDSENRGLSEARADYASKISAFEKESILQGYDGHSTRMKGFIDSYKENLEASDKPDHVRNHVLNNMSNSFLNHQLAAETYENKSRAQNYVTEEGRKTDLLASSYSGSTTKDDLVRDINDKTTDFNSAIGIHGSPEQMKSMLVEHKKALTVGFLETGVSEADTPSKMQLGIDKIKQVLGDENLRTNLTPKQIRQYSRIGQSLEKKIEKENNDSIFEYVTDIQNAAPTNVDISSDITKASEMIDRSTLEPEQKKNMKASLGEAGFLNRLDFNKTLPFEDTEARVNEELSAPQFKGLNRLEKAAIGTSMGRKLDAFKQNHLAKLSKDGAAYLSDDKLYQTYAKNALTSPEKFDAFVKFTDEVYDQNGINKDLRTYIPPQLEGVLNNLNHLISEDPISGLAELEQLERRVGAGNLSKLTKESNLPSNIWMMTEADPSKRMDLLKSFQKPAKDQLSISKQFDLLDKKVPDDEIYAKIDKHSDMESFKEGVVGSDAYFNVKEAKKNYIKSIMVRNPGLSLDDASNQAADLFTNNMQPIQYGNKQGFIPNMNLRDTDKLKTFLEASKDDSGIYKIQDKYDIYTEDDRPYTQEHFAKDGTWKLSPDKKSYIAYSFDEAKQGSFPLSHKTKDNTIEVIRVPVKEILKGDTYNPVVYEREEKRAQYDRWQKMWGSKRTMGKDFGKESTNRAVELSRSLFYGTK